jgi:oligopeptide/dipeptide ABC transporter ATP-binding protein
MMLLVANLRVWFGAPGRELVAVDGLSFEVGEGEIFAIIGESGSGKTLTGMSIVGLTPPMARASGSIRLLGRELLNRPDSELRRVRGREIGIVYQDPLGALNPVWPVGDQIAEALRAHRLADRNTAARRATELLDRVHIPDAARVARAYPHEISGGMRQRAMIAMALACGPKLLIADEPTTALDVTIKAQILDLLSELRREMALTVIIITHDMGVVAELADRILVMYAGRAAEIGPAEAIMRRPAHPYTQALMLSAMMSESLPKRELPAIIGTAPMLHAHPTGCRFHPRCPLAEADCRREIPPLRACGQVHLACHHPIAGPARGVVEPAEATR